MGSTAELVRELRGILKENKDPSLQDKIERCVRISSGLESFIENTCSDESEMQKKITEDTLKDPKASRGFGMLSGHTVGQLLRMFAETVKAKRILEIGMYTGYSAVTFAETTFCEEVVSLDLSKYYEAFLKDRIKGTPLQDKIRIIIGPASESLLGLKNERKCFDLVFIDADKTGYMGYYKYIMDNGLLSHHGVILCDNILWGNDTFLDQESEGGKALAEFVKFVKKDPRVDQMILPHRDGVMWIKPKQ